jgi:hypothetical protein
MDNWKEGSQVADSLTGLLKQSKPYLEANWKK